MDGEQASLAPMGKSPTPPRPPLGREWGREEVPYSSTWRGMGRATPAPLPSLASLIPLGFVSRFWSPVVTWSTSISSSSSTIEHILVLLGFMLSSYCPTLLSSFSLSFDSHFVCVFIIPAIAIHPLLYLE